MWCLYIWDITSLHKWFNGTTQWLYCSALNCSCLLSSIQLYQFSCYCFLQCASSKAPAFTTLRLRSDIQLNTDADSHHDLRQRRIQGQFCQFFVDLNSNYGLLSQKCVVTQNHLKTLMKSWKVISGIETKHLENSMSCFFFFFLMFH